MAYDNFKPTIWSDKVFNQYQKNLVFKSLMNLEYEGEIKSKGDQVKISQIGAVTVNSYTGAAITYEELTDSSKFLVVDQQDYAAVSLDDVDNAQTNPKLLNSISNEIGIGLAGDVDEYIASLYDQYGELVSGTSSSPTSVTSATVTGLFNSAGIALSDNNVPQDNRVAVCPPWLVGKIGLARIIRETDNSRILDSGFRGTFMGFNIYESNNVSHSSTTWYAPMFFRAGDTIAFASQITKMEAIRSETLFADKLRALNTYGAKVIRPSSLAIMYLAEGAESAI